jgi:hypothetical protein
VAAFAAKEEDGWWHNVPRVSAITPNQGYNELDKGGIEGEGARDVAKLPSAANKVVIISQRCYCSCTSLLFTSPTTR